MADHVYVLGAGRSGTTVLSVLLGGEGSLRHTGELLHLPKWWRQSMHCSCGLALSECSTWQQAGRLIGGSDTAAVDATIRDFDAVESHARVAAYLLAPGRVPRDYLRRQKEILDALRDGGGIVDGSKYVARALAFRELDGHRFRYVYIVRDCRGVIHSFRRRGAQRERSVLSAALYYLAVNGAAQLAVWTRLRGRAIKLRYEDLVRDPAGQLQRIGRFLGLDMSEVARRVAQAEPFEIGHIVSGNRLRTSGAVKLSADEEWRSRMSFLQRVGCYLLCLPIQVLNRYRI